MPKPFQDSLGSSLAPVERAATGWEPPRQPCSSWDGPECPVQVAESSRWQSRPVEGRGRELFSET